MEENVKSDENIISQSLKHQTNIENLISGYFNDHNFETKNSEGYNDNVNVFNENHLQFAMFHKNQLSSGYAALDSGLPWFSYWVLNIFDIFGINEYTMSSDFKSNFITYLKFLIHPHGGLMGYSFGESQLIATYAGILSIISLDCEEAYKIIDREKMKKYLMDMKNKSNNFSFDKNFIIEDNIFIVNGLNENKMLYDINGNFLMKKNSEKIRNFEVQHEGSFQVHYNGESDLRAVYCVLIIAFILDIMDEELTNGIAENIAKCQTFEGGLGPEPFAEAHGGYNFCGIASLILLNKLNCIDLNKQIKWLVNRQMTIEGGFNGRTNKLVDSCYSFWQASVFNMLIEKNPVFSYDKELLYDQLSLQAYILFACQQKEGGIVDKPGKKPDLFHTNYAGTALGLSKKCLLKETNSLNINNDHVSNDEYSSFKSSNKNDILISLFNENIADMDPIYCLPKEKVDRAYKYYKNITN
jgi:protein farnesyltransferase subunit beta